MPLRSLLLPVVLWVWTQAVFAGPFEDALLAHDEGRYEDARELLLPMAEAGHVEAQDKLSHMNWYGEGAPADYAAAHEWARKAVALGSATAHYNIGAHYRSGTGVPRDDKLGFEWQLKSAELGDPRGAGAVSLAYLVGDGVVADPVKARHWREVALDLGDPVIQFAEAFLLMRSGLAEDADADRLLQSAAAQHLNLAQFALGMAFLEGSFGWPQDAVQAHMWLSLAADEGCIEAVVMLKRAAEQMSEAELDSSPALLEAWRQGNPVPAGDVHVPRRSSCQMVPQING